MTAGGGGEGGRETWHVSTRPRLAHGPTALRHWRGAVALGGEAQHCQCCTGTPRTASAAGLVGCLRAPSSPAAGPLGRSRGGRPTGAPLVDACAFWDWRRGVAARVARYYVIVRGLSRWGGRSRRGLAPRAPAARPRGAAISPRRLRDASSPAAGPDRRCARPGPARHAGGEGWPSPQAGGLQPELQAEVQGGGYPTPARRRGGRGRRSPRARSTVLSARAAAGAAPAMAGGRGRARGRAERPASLGRAGRFRTSTLPLH